MFDTVVDDDQLGVLMDAFNISAYPPTADRELLGRKLGMTSRSVQIWVGSCCEVLRSSDQFQNRRRAIKVEQQSAQQKASGAVDFRSGQEEQATPLFRPGWRDLRMSSKGESGSNLFVGRSASSRDRPDEAEGIVKIEK